MTSPTQSAIQAMSASQIAAAIAGDTLTALDVADALLARIAERDALIHAWAFVAPESVRATADASDRQAQGRGPLHGVPFGVKDIIDTCDLPTGMGSSIYDGYRSRNDAPCVAIPKSAGAIVLGKTTTSEFASLSPVATRNPHDTSRMTGVSSAGSAAAVADRMVPIALGTQTGGSVLRPASFCGCIGFKPTFATYSIVGVKPAVTSFDTIGLLARTMDDVALFHAVLTASPPPRPGALRDGSAPRIGLCRTDLWDTAQPATHAAIEDAAKRLSANGAKITEVAWPGSLHDLMHYREAINNTERAHGHSYEWFTDQQAFGQLLRDNISRGWQTDRTDYLAAQRALDRCRRDAEVLFEGVDILLTPCAAGEAPAHDASPIDAGYQQIWSMLHTPSISLPTHRGPSNLPVGIQLVAPRWQDERLLAASAWVLDTLGAA